MLRQMRQGKRGVLWFVIIVVGGVFVFYLGFGGAFAPAMPGGVVVQVEDRSYTLRDVENLRFLEEERERERLGDAFDAAASREIMDERAARLLLNRALLAREAERLGLRVSDREVRDYLRRMPGLTDERGRLDRDGLTALAEQNYGSLKRFEQAIRDELLASKAYRLLAESVDVTEQEVREALRYVQEEAEIAYVALDPARLAADLEVPEERVAAKLDGSEAAEAELRAAYEARRREFELPERRAVRRILFRTGMEASEEEIEAARERAEAAHARIVAGEDFAAVASEVSDDESSKEKGGLLEPFARGELVPSFEEAAFSLEPGQLSEPVRTPFGWDVLQLAEVLPAESHAFEDVREELARELVRRELGAEQARQLAEELQTAIREGGSLTEAARDAGLSLQRPDPLRRRADGVIPGLGPAPELLTAVFALPQEAEQPSADRIFEIGERLVLVQRTGLTSPSDEELAPDLELTRLSLTQRRRNDALQRWLTERQQALSEAGQLRLDLGTLRGES